MPSLPVPAITLRSLHERLAPTGLNLVGAVLAEDFDRTQPSGRRVCELAPRCGSVVVVASGGRDFWQHMRAATGAPTRPPHGDYQPISERCATLSAELQAWLARHGVKSSVACPARHPNLNFVQLAEVAGLGVVSPVADWLMHPDYGPWVSVRFAMLLDGTPLGASLHRRVSGEFQPCLGCHQPCVPACPVDACAGGAFDVGRCTAHRCAGGCASRCEMKRACPCGAAHRYGEEEERFRQASALLSLPRAQPPGWWRFVPRGLRPGEPPS